MNCWYYRTANRYEGHVWADSDDQAWNKVVELTQQSPLVLRLLRQQPHELRRVA